MTVLLAACGGGSADLASPTQSTAQPEQNLAMVSAAGPTAAADAPTTEQASHAAGEFAISGYEAADSVQADATQVGASGMLSEGNVQLSTVSAAAPQAALAVTPATPYNVYVSASGNDSSAGTASAPWKTLARAIRNVKPGTTVWVAPGSYVGGVKNTVSGTPSSRIYFVSTTRWGAKIVPAASSPNNTAFDNRGNYVDIVGFEIDGSKHQSGTRWTHGVYTGGSNDVVRNNHVHHIATGSTCTSAGGSAIGIDAYYGGLNGTVTSNLVHDIGPAGCRYIQGIYMSTTGSITNNVVYRVAEAAIHLWHDARNVTIANNTVTASHTGIIVGAGDHYKYSGPADYVYVHNNIVFDNAMGISEQGATGTHNTYRNNLVYQNPTYNFQLHNGVTHSGTVSSNPLFVSYTRTGTPNLAITVSSPAVGRGTSTYAPSTDIVDRPRNASTGFDIGAYQH